MMTYIDARAIVGFTLDHAASYPLETAATLRCEAYNHAVDSLCRLCQVGAAVFHRALERPGEPQHKGDA